MQFSPRQLQRARGGLRSTEDGGGSCARGGGTSDTQGGTAAIATPGQLRRARAGLRQSHEGPVATVPHASGVLRHSTRSADGGVAALTVTPPEDAAAPGPVQSAPCPRQRAAATPGTAGQSRRNGQSQRSVPTGQSQRNGRRRRRHRECCAEYVPLPEPATLPPDATALAGRRRVQRQRQYVRAELTALGLLETGAAHAPGVTRLTDAVLDEAVQRMGTAGLLAGPRSLQVVQKRQGAAKLTAVVQLLAHRNALRQIASGTLGRSRHRSTARGQRLQSSRLPHEATSMSLQIQQPDQVAAPQVTNITTASHTAAAASARSAGGLQRIAPVAPTVVAAAAATSKMQDGLQPITAVTVTAGDAEVAASRIKDDGKDELQTDAAGNPRQIQSVCAQSETMAVEKLLRRVEALTVSIDRRLTGAAVGDVVWTRRRSADKAIDPNKFTGWLRGTVETVLPIPGLLTVRYDACPASVAGLGRESSASGWVTIKAADAIRVDPNAVEDEGSRWGENERTVQALDALISRFSGVRTDGTQTDEERESPSPMAATVPAMVPATVPATVPTLPAVEDRPTQLPASPPLWTLPIMVMVAGSATAAVVVSPVTSTLSSLFVPLLLLVASVGTFYWIALQRRLNTAGVSAGAESVQSSSAPTATVDADTAKAWQATAAILEDLEASSDRFVAGGGSELLALRKQVQSLRAILAMQGVATADNWDAALESAEARLRAATEKLMTADLSAAEMLEAEREYDKWEQRVSKHPDYTARLKREAEEWDSANAAACASALQELKKLLPTDSATGPNKLELVKRLGQAVGERLWDKRVLWLPHMDVATVSR
eukprot:SAG31_NODE_1522_length_8012_cov_6.903336_2_plen_831_part_00